MHCYETNGCYGSGNPCTVFVCVKSSGLQFYCVEGSRNVNSTFDTLPDFINVEQVSDVDGYSSREDINTLEQLADFVEN